MVASLPAATTFSIFSEIAFQLHRVLVEIAELDHDRRIRRRADLRRIEFLVLVAQRNLDAALRMRYRAHLRCWCRRCNPPGRTWSRALKNETAAARRSRFDLRRILVVAQVAISLLLLIGAGLFVRSLSNLQNLDPGFLRESVLLVSVNPQASGYQGPAPARLL